MKKKIIEGKIRNKRVKVRLRMHRNKGPEFMVEGKLTRRLPNVKECEDICPFHSTDCFIFFDPVCLNIRNWLTCNEEGEGTEVLPIKKERCK